MKLHHRYLSIIALLAFFALPSHAENQIKRFEAADSEGVEAARDEYAVYLSIDPNIKGPISIPRLAAPLRSMRWHRHDDTGDITLKPERDTWVISWKNRPEDSSAIILNFGATPLLPSEVRPGTAMTDGSFYLPAHFAATRGEKIRYEPQPYKNTVGYWVGKEDMAAWTIQIDKPGRFNVAVLQGCGKGQGGSTATMSFISPVKDITPTIEFEVVETGHWQNFQWVQHGEVELRHAGEVEVTVAPKQIKKAAQMDIRAIHLIRLPDKK